MDRGAEAMQETPEQEGPSCPVPQAADQKGSYQVLIGAQVSLPVAPERDVDVIPQEPAERHVQAPPEIGDVQGSVGRVEIDRKLDIEQERGTERHVRVG